MKNVEVKKTEKTALVRGTEKTLSGVANFFAGILCLGNLYEVKVPKQLQK